jgi:hypothetical protein
MGATNKEMKIRAQMLDLQKAKLLKRWDMMKKRDAFVKKRIKKILSLSMQGWPKLKEMKDRAGWIDIVFEAKIVGIYGMGTANCDVIALLESKAKELSKTTK